VHCARRLRWTFAVRYGVKNCLWIALIAVR